MRVGSILGKARRLCRDGRVENEGQAEQTERKEVRSLREEEEQGSTV